MSLSNSGVDYKSQVLAATDLVQLIGQTVALKRRGKDFVGLCPFHQEKTGSFHVSPAKQFFYCFGCKKHGTAIDFVMERDRVDFKEALLTLGRAAGLEMPRFGANKQANSERQMLLEAQSAACMFFEKMLAGDTGAEARAYLAKRGIDAESVKRFRIGYAPPGWSGLLTALARKFAPRQLELAGLAKPNTRGDGHYDTFRNRLMFPIRDEQGRIIAFGGRVMPGSEDPAKYLNSPETPLFSKSRCVFGLDLARQRIIETGTVAVCEGYTDVIMAHQFGVSNVVSVLGTAMTEQHLAMLRRFAGRIVLLFDADQAGDMAVDRVVELFLRHPVEMAIASMPQGMDPDEYLLQFGKEAFEKLLSEANNALEHKWKVLVRQVGERGDMTGRQKAVEQYLELLAGARGSGPVDNLRWGAALARVSRLTDMPIDELQRRFRVKRPAGGPAQKRPAAPPVLDAQQRIERALLGLLLCEPQRWAQVQQFVHVEDFSQETCRKLAEAYWAHQRDEGEPVFNEFLSTLGEAQVRELAVELVEQGEGNEDGAKVLEEAVGFFGAARQRQEQQKHLAAVERTKDQKLSEEQETALLAELMKNNPSTNLFRLGPVRRAGS